jgi:hypothetical protein
VVEGYAQSIGENPPNRPQSMRTFITRLHVAWFVELVQQEGRLSRKDAIRTAAKAFARSESAVKQDVAFARHHSNANWDEIKKYALDSWRKRNPVDFEL